MTVNLGELTTAGLYSSCIFPNILLRGKILGILQAEALGKLFRTLYPGYPQNGILNLP